MTTAPTFSYRETSEADRTYIKRLNYLTEVFGDETVTPPSEDFLAGSEFYVGKWVPTDGILVMDEDLDNPAGAAWLIFATQECRGMGFVAEDIPELAIAVERRYRGSGLGTQLLRRATQWTREQGHGGVSLCVHRNNPGARKLYEREGFELVGPATDGYDTLVKKFSEATAKV